MGQSSSSSLNDLTFQTQDDRTICLACNRWDQLYIGNLPQATDVRQSILDVLESLISTHWPKGIQTKTDVGGNAIIYKFKGNPWNPRRGISFTSNNYSYYVLLIQLVERLHQMHGYKIFLSTNYVHLTSRHTLMLRSEKPNFFQPSAPFDDSIEYMGLKMELYHELLVLNAPLAIQSKLYDRLSATIKNNWQRGIRSEKLISPNVYSYLLSYPWIVLRDDKLEPYKLLWLAAIEMLARDFGFYLVSSTDFLNNHTDMLVFARSSNSTQHVFPLPYTVSPTSTIPVVQPPAVMSSPVSAQPAPTPDAGDLEYMYVSLARLDRLRIIKGDPQAHMLVKEAINRYYERGLQDTVTEPEQVQKGIAEYKLRGFPWRQSEAVMIQAFILGVIFNLASDNWRLWSGSNVPPIFGSSHCLLFARTRTRARSIQSAPKPAICSVSLAHTDKVQIVNFSADEPQVAQLNAVVKDLWPLGIQKESISYCSGRHWSTNPHYEWQKDRAVGTTLKYHGRPWSTYHFEDEYQVRRSMMMLCVLDRLRSQGWTCVGRFGWKSGDKQEGDENPATNVFSDTYFFVQTDGSYTI